MLMPKTLCSGVCLKRLFEHDVRELAALELDDDAHAVLVGLVAQLADAFELLLAHELGDAAR